MATPALRISHIPDGRFKDASKAGSIASSRTAGQLIRGRVVVFARHHLRASFPRLRQPALRDVTLGTEHRQ